LTVNPTCLAVAYLAAIPSYVVTHQLPAFLGCAAALAAE